MDECAVPQFQESGGSGQRRHELRGGVAAQAFVERRSQMRRNTSEREACGCAVATGANEAMLAGRLFPAPRRNSSLLPYMMRARLRFDMATSVCNFERIIHLSIVRFAASKVSHNTGQASRK